MEFIEFEGQRVRPPRSGKSIVINGNHYRMRRGKLVQIPAEWVGKIPNDQTMRKRGSHKIKKRRRDEKSMRNTSNSRGAEFAEQLMLKNGAKSVE